jgi:hypothetical protein
MDYWSVAASLLAYPLSNCIQLLIVTVAIENFPQANL